jgi:hypothetical protein
MKPHVLAFLFALAATPAMAQAPGAASSTPSPLPPVPKQGSLAGPRFGVTVLSDSTVAALKERHIEVSHAISQFGWQFERQFYSKAGGPSVLNEWVVLAGGLDQGLVLPSVNWMVGLRTREGAEFGIGPNLSPAGAALAIAAGVTMRVGMLNVPVTFAAVPSRSGTRISVLVGFTLRR